MTNRKTWSRFIMHGQKHLPKPHKSSTMHSSDLFFLSGHQEVFPAFKQKSRRKNAPEKDLRFLHRFLPPPLRVCVLCTRAAGEKKAFLARTHAHCLSLFYTRQPLEGERPVAECSFSLSSALLKRASSKNAAFAV